MDEERREIIRKRNVKYYHDNKEQINERKKHYKFMAENNLNKPFKWVGVNGGNIRSAGGSEEYLRSRELGSNYLQDLFKD